MKKSDLVSKISHKINYLTNQDIDEGITYILNLISESLQNRDRVEIRGFGSFSARKRSSRIARNPNTGDAISIGSKYHPYFRASKTLKADLNK
tara:strand:- start:401 stop:679 length:279 start_codon:yes stop_codon:yes gene_type:complete